MFLCSCNHLINYVQVAAAFGDGSEELPLLEVAVLVEVPEALLPADARLALGQLLVELVLQSLVPEDDVVGAGEVLDVVRALASTADGVADLPLLSFVVGQVVEEELGAVVPVAVVEVLEIDHVLVLDLPGVRRVPAAQDETRGQGLVAEQAEHDVAVVVVYLGEEDLLHVVERQRFRAFALVFTPLRGSFEPLQHVEDRAVVLAVVLVQRRAAVVGEDVVDVAVALGNVRLVAILPALDEELLDVVVGHVLLRRDEVARSWRKREPITRRELARVHREYWYWFAVQHRSPLFVDGARAAFLPTYFFRLL